MALWRIICAAEEEWYSMEPQLRVRLTSWAWKGGALVQLELGRRHGAEPARAVGAPFYHG